MNTFVLTYISQYVYPVSDELVHSNKFNFHKELVNFRIYVRIYLLTFKWIFI